MSSDICEGSSGSVFLALVKFRTGLGDLTTDGSEKKQTFLPCQERLKATEELSYLLLFIFASNLTQVCLLVGN